MPKPFKTAIVDENWTNGYGYRERAVNIGRSKAGHGRCTAQFYAPGWRPMAFKTVEHAIAKLARHPGFIRWEA